MIDLVCNSASPVTGGRVKLVNTLSAKHISSLYKKELGFDIDPYLDKNITFDLLECLDTGYQFYSPLDKVEGSPDFYAELYSTAGKEWGYSDDKWEHNFALKYCLNVETLIDVGCGGGAFLSKAREHVGKVIGLETSPHGRKTCERLGVTALDEVIQSHQASHLGEYDLLCSFQVLEHVANVKEFIESSIAVVRPGGKIIFSVPNNEGYVGAQDLPLNFPPHHVGRWGAASLEALSKFYRLDLVGLHHEPLQPENINWYQAYVEKTYLPRSRLLKTLWYRLRYSDSLNRFLKDNAHTIHGHTVMAVYQVR